MAIYHKMEQQSHEWFVIRLGLPTASEFHRILSPTGKLSTQATDYCNRLLAEQMLGHALDADFQTQWMIRGQELEDTAIEAYEFATGLETQPGGFVTADGLTYGCSPDRLVGAEGLIEMKCPSPNTHIGYLIDPETMRQDKKPQVMGELLTTERKWVDLVSYHPELPPVILRVERDEEYINKLRKALESFAADLRSGRADLEARFGKFPKIAIVKDEGPVYDEL